MTDKFKALATIGQMTLRGHRVLGSEMLDTLLIISKMYRETGKPLTLAQIAKLCKIGSSGTLLRIRKLEAFGLIERDASSPRRSIVPAKLSWVIEPIEQSSETNIDRENDLHATEQGLLGCWSVQNAHLQGDLRTVPEQTTVADQP